MFFVPYVSATWRKVVKALLRNLCCWCRSSCGRSIRRSQQPPRARGAAKPSVSGVPAHSRGWRSWQCSLLAATIGPLVGERSARPLRAHESFRIAVTWSHLFGNEQPRTRSARASGRRLQIVGLLSVRLRTATSRSAAGPSDCLGSASLTSTKAGHVLEEAATVWQALPVLPDHAAVRMSANPFAFWRVRSRRRSRSAPSPSACCVVRANTSNLDLKRVEDRWRAAPSDWRRERSIVAASSGILLDETLAFMGFGAIPGDSAFGALISDGGSDAITYLRIWLIPCVALTAVLFGFMLVRRSLDDEVPPHMYER